MWRERSSLVMLALAPGNNEFYFKNNNNIFLNFSGKIETAIIIII